MSITQHGITINKNITPLDDTIQILKAGEGALKKNNFDILYRGDEAGNLTLTLIFFADMNPFDYLDKIPDAMFGGAMELESVGIPNGFTEISKHMFAGCENLKTVNIPNSVKTIKAGAFLGCKNLSEIYIPESVTRIERGAFEGCDKVKLTTPSRKGPLRLHVSKDEINAFYKQHLTFIKNNPDSEE